MRVLIVSSGLCPEHFGGLPSHVEDLLHALREAGEDAGYLNVGAKSRWPVTRLTRHDHQPWPEWRLSSRRAYARYWTGTIDPESQICADKAYLRAFFAVVEQFKPEIVHFHELTSVPVEIFEKLATKGIKLVFSAHDFYALCPTAKLFRPNGTMCQLTTEALDCQNCCSEAGLDRFNQWQYANDLWLNRWPRIRNAGRRILRNCERGCTSVPQAASYQQRRSEFLRCLSFADMVLVTSREQETLFSRHGGRTLRLRYLPLSRRSIRSDRPEPRVETVFPGKLRVLALNIVNPAKGSELIKSTFTILAEEFSGVELHVYGLEPGTAPGIRYHGPYDDTELDEIVSQADFGILPSVWPEAYGYVGPEMLSRGMPVVASTMGAMKDYVVDGENGLLFDPAIKGDLTDKIRMLIADGALRSRLWNGAASGPRNYLTMDEHVDQLRGIYQEIVSGRP